MDLDQGTGTGWEARATDLSATGVGITLDGPSLAPDVVRPGCLLRCAVRHRRAPAAIWARVTWTDGCRVGLELVAPLEKIARRQLASLLAGLEAAEQADFFKRMPVDPTLVDSGTWERGRAWGCSAAAVSIPRQDPGLGRVFSAALVVGLLATTLWAAICQVV